MSGIAGFCANLAIRCLNLSLAAYAGKSNFTGGKMVLMFETNGLYQPVFYCYQIGLNLFISIRGTESVNDYDSAYHFEEKQYTFGNYKLFAHSGFYMAADYVFNHVKDSIKKCRGKVYVTGHSYGASVATILEVMINTNAETKSFSGGAIVFGPAPAISELPEELNNMIVTINTINDGIPRFSVPNAFALVKPFWGGKTSTKEFLVKAMNKYMLSLKGRPGIHLPDVFFDSGAKIIPDLCDAIIAYANDPSTYNVRFVSGDVYKCGSFNPSLKTDKTKANLYNQVVISSVALNDHLPEEYANKIRKLKD